MEAVYSKAGISACLSIGNEDVEARSGECRLELPSTRQFHDAEYPFARLWLLAVLYTSDPLTTQL